MVVTVLLLLCGTAAVVGLTLRAARRARALTRRIAEVQEEMERNPLPPYAALGTLMQEREEGEGKRTPHAGAPAPRFPRRGEDGHRHG